MGPWCKNELENQIYDSRIDLITQVNQLAKEKGVDSASLTLVDFTNTDDFWLLSAFNHFTQSLKDHSRLWKHGILLLANKKGQVMKIIATDNVPEFLNKPDTMAIDFGIDASGSNAIGLVAKTGKLIIVQTDEHFLSHLQKYHTVAVPLYKNDQVIAILGYIVPPEYYKESIRRLHKLAIIFNIVIDEFKKLVVLRKETEKKDALLKISNTLYSSFDVNEVLTQAVRYIHQFYPGDKLELWMTQDYPISNVTIRQLNVVPNKNGIVGKAFLEGQLIVNNNGELASPLIGKQGIYGVIHLAYDKPVSYEDEKVHFISSIANILSTAFENAKLYQQTVHLVKELQVINDLTKRLNQSLNKESILQFFINEAIQLFEANHAFVYQITDSGELIIIASNQKEYIGEILPVNDGYMGLVYKNKEPIIISDVKEDEKIDDSFFNKLGSKSLVSVPILLNNNIIGIIAISSEKTYYFSYDNFKMLQLFAQHLGLTLTNAILHERIQHLAISDYLTGLYNRSYLDEQVKKSQEEDLSGAILLFDIDDFKTINDTYGHQVGDKVLVQVANILKANIRGNDIASRWGGEELAIYLPNVQVEIASQIAERISERIRTETNPAVTVSCGLAIWGEIDEGVNNVSLLRNADQALYDAKNNGKNRVVIYRSL